jgi:HAT1-interacting factor 1
MTLDSVVEQAKRAFALKKYEQAVDFYATALEFA